MGLADFAKLFKSWNSTGSCFIYAGHELVSLVWCRV